MHDDDAWRACVPDDEERRARLRAGYERYADEHPTPWRELVNRQGADVMATLREWGVATAVCSSSPARERRRMPGRAGGRPPCQTSSSAGMRLTPPSQTPRSISAPWARFGVTPEETRRGGGLRHRHSRRKGVRGARGARCASRWGPSQASTGRTSSWETSTSWSPFSSRSPPVACAPFSVGSRYDSENAVTDRSTNGYMPVMLGCVRSALRYSGCALATEDQSTRYTLGYSSAILA